MGESVPQIGKPAWGAIIAALVLMAGLALLWHFTPLAQLVTAEKVVAWAEEFGEQPWAPLVVIFAYAPACVVMFPRPLITLASVIAFGPWLGFAYAITGIVGASVLTWLAGRRMRRDTVRQLAGPRLDRMIEVLKRNGLLAMTLLRLVPIAPFAVEGIVAGAVRIKLWHLVAGTVLGVLPGTLASTVFGDQLENALTGTGEINHGLIVGVVIALVAGAWLVRRWFRKMERRMHDAPARQPR
jgi:uncharacterized membrane protein YdjX (TVP38/TMEM64 family)